MPPSFDAAASAHARTPAVASRTDEALAPRPLITGRPAPGNEAQRAADDAAQEVIDRLRGQPHVVARASSASADVDVAPDGSSADVARKVVDRLRAEPDEGPSRAQSLSTSVRVVRRFLMPIDELSDAGVSGRHTPGGARKKFEYLRDQLTKYHAAPADQKPHYADKIAEAADGWLASNTEEEKPAKHAAVTKLRRQAAAEIGLASAAGGPSAIPTLMDVQSKDGAMLQPAYQVSDEPLFPEDPTAEHVLQGKLGDCFLLATAAAIARKDPNLIREMMRDNGATVSVRLYTDVGPEYVTVDKSVPMVTVTDPDTDEPVQHPAYVRGALWVQMLEKAHAAKKGRYADLHSGGTGAIAISALLGVASDDLLGLAAQPSPLPWPEGYPLDTVRNGRGEARTVGHGTSTRVYAWVFGTDADVWKGLMEDEDFYHAVFGARTIEDVDKVCSAERQMTPAMKAKLLGYLEDEGLRPGRIGTGVYTRVEEARWTKMVTAIDAHRVVTAGTPGAANQREAKDRGMVLGHQYTVLDYRVDDNDVKWVRVRNPWGRYARDYVPSVDGSELEPVVAGSRKGDTDGPTDEQAAGVSTLEWGDFLSTISELVAG